MPLLIWEVVRDSGWKVGMVLSNKLKEPETFSEALRI